MLFLLISWEITSLELSSSYTVQRFLLHSFVTISCNAFSYQTLWKHRHWNCSHLTPHNASLLHSFVTISCNIFFSPDSQKTSILSVSIAHHVMPFITLLSNDCLWCLLLPNPGKFLPWNALDLTSCNAFYYAFCNNFLCHFSASNSQKISKMKLSKFTPCNTFLLHFFITIF